MADCEDRSLLVSPTAALDGGTHGSSSGAALAVSGVELRGETLTAEVDGQRLSASVCLHRCVRPGVCACTAWRGRPCGMCASPPASTFSHHSLLNEQPAATAMRRFWICGLAASSTSSGAEAAVVRSLCSLPDGCCLPARRPTTAACRASRRTSLPTSLLPLDARRRPVVRRWQRSGEASRQAGVVVTPMPGRVVKVRGGDLLHMMLSFLPRLPSGVCCCVQRSRRPPACRASRPPLCARMRCNGTSLRGAQVCVEQGAPVDEGDPLVVVEAMKMEHTGATRALFTTLGVYWSPWCKW